MRDTSQFRERFLRWKAGELVYDAGKAIPHLAIGDDGEPADATRVFNPRSLIPAIPAFIKNQQALLRQLASLLSYVGPETRERSEVQRVHLQAVLDWSKYLKQKLLEKINEGYEQLATLVDKGVTIASVAVPALKGIGKLASKGISALMKKAAPLRIPKIDMMKSYENDTPARWYLNGGDLNLPEMIPVYHGRGTNRGVPEEVIRNYSHKDVGIHVATSREPAEGFAHLDEHAVKTPGFLYSGTYVGPRTPDLISGDFGTWDAGRWNELLNDYMNAEWKPLEQTVYNELFPQMRSINEIERNTAQTTLKDIDLYYSKPQSAKALIDHFKIDPAYILLNKVLLDRIKDKYKKKYYADLTPAEQELEIREYAEANKAYADYLKSKGVAFKYHNDFEGGSYTRPSMFISDPSDVWWNKQILATPIQIKQPAIGIAYDNPFVPTGELYPAEQLMTRYKYIYPKQQ